MIIRHNLIIARENKNLNKKEVAKNLNVTPRHYRRLEAGTSNGSLEIWDKLELLFNIPQQNLRKNRVLDISQNNNTPKPKKEKVI